MFLQMLCSKNNDSNMSIAEFLKVIANYDGGNLEPVKIHLKNNPSLINKVHEDLHPLSTALRNKNCSAELVKLLFLFGANVNYIKNKPRIGCPFGPLCTALQNVQSIDVIKLLLDSGKFPENACKKHHSDMDCIMRCPNSRLKEDLFKLLIEKGLNVDVDGKLLLCKALQFCTEANDIKVLLNAGASLKGCMVHMSPFDCATSSTSSVLLKADVVKVLIDVGAVMGEATANCFTPLERALFYREYETEAIKLLLDYPEEEFNKERGAHLLHLAVQNASCKTSAIKLLLDYGAPVNIPNKRWIEGNTELHEALVIGCCAQPSVIDILIKNGSDVNAVNGYGDTPLILVSKSFSFPYNPANQQDIARILLRADAQINLGFNYCKCKEECICVAYITLIRVWVFCCVNKCEEAFKCFKLLAKYLFLQYPEFVLDNFLDQLCDENLLKEFVKIEYHLGAKRFYRGVIFFKDKLLNFVRNCICEVHVMNSVYVADGLTLYEFVSICSFNDSEKEAKYDFNELLKIMSVYTFPIFFDVITFKVGRSGLEINVQKVQIYAIKNCLGFARKKIILNYESICRIASFLSDEDFLKLIVAFYNPGLVDNNSGHHEIANSRKTAEHNDMAHFIQKKIQSVTVFQTEQSEILKFLPQKNSINKARSILLSKILSFFPE